MAHLLDLQKRNINDKKLIGWVTTRKDAAEDYYKKNYQDDWKKYRFLWETKFDETLRTRKSERSKLITPTTQVAVDTASADLDAAVGYLDFFQVDPGIPVKERLVWNKKFASLWDEMIQNFKLDLEDTGSRLEISEAVFLSALLGIGHIKIVSEDRTDITLKPGENGVGVSSVEKIRKLNKLVSVDPNKLWYDPSATTEDDAEYLVEETEVAESVIDGKIESGVYNKPAKPLPKINIREGSARIVYEYHGLVPQKFLLDEAETALTGLEIPEFVTDKMVEAIVIWVKGTQEPLFAEETPFLDKRKSYASFQWDMNPGNLVGKGVAAKGFNIQKAQDANIRARTDALAYAVHPMVGVDSLKLVNKRRMIVGPGRQVSTHGDPNKAITTFRFGDIPQSVFIQAGELAQMADNATGLQAFSGVDPTYQSAQGLDTLSLPSVNRNRRTLERLNNFLKRVVEMFLWRGTQYDSERYPPIAPKFNVRVVVGSLTRKSEMAQVSGMLKTLPETSAAYWRLLVKYFELSDLPDKAQVIGDVRELADRALNPPEPQPSFAERIALRTLRLEELKAMESLRLQRGRVRAELVRAAATLEKIDSEEAKNQSIAILNIAKAESEESGKQIAEYMAIVETLKQDAEGTGEQFTSTVIGGAAGVGRPGQASRQTGVVGPGETIPGNEG